VDISVFAHWSFKLKRPFTGAGGDDSVYFRPLVFASLNPLVQLWCNHYLLIVYTSILTLYQCSKLVLVTRADCAVVGLYNLVE